jgi:type II secretory pathway component PulK
LGDRHQQALNNRGVALIIVLLVTALLIALIFEFAYGTRVSLRAAVNFRNSQRAYFLLRSGLVFFAKYPELRNYIPQGECQPLPYVSEGDRQLTLCWEDESGKIDISQVIQSDPIMFPRLTNLFDIRGVDTNLLNQISYWMTNNSRTRFYRLSELHQFMSDEQFGKVQDALTVSQATKINVNTASEDVLKSICRSVGYTDGAAKNIEESRTAEAFTDDAKLGSFLTNNNLGRLTSAVTTTSSDFKVNLYATVGGYTRHIEAIVKVGGSAYLVNYWREL